MIDNLVAMNFGNLPLGDFPGWITRHGLGLAAGYEPDVYPPDLSPVTSMVERVMNSGERLARTLMSGEDVTWEDLFSRAYGATVDLTTIMGLPTHLLREAAKPAKTRTTYVSLLNRRKYALDRKKKELEKEGKVLSAKELSELAIIRAFNTRAINKLRAAAKAAEKRGDTAKAEGLRKQAEDLATKVFDEHVKEGGDQ